ncbi:hypothetical protein V8C34DRAFT_306506 [Trichoderma compactum]
MKTNFFVLFLASVFTAAMAAPAPVAQPAVEEVQERNVANCYNNSGYKRDVTAC